MKRKCGITGCINQARFQCNLCGLPLCEIHAFVVPEKGTYFCRGCWVYSKAKAGEVVFTGKGGLEYGDVDAKKS